MVTNVYIVFAPWIWIWISVHGENPVSNSWRVLVRGRMCHLSLHLPLSLILHFCCMLLVFMKSQCFHSVFTFLVSFSLFHPFFTPNQLRIVHGSRDVTRLGWHISSLMQGFATAWWPCLFWCISEHHGQCVDGYGSGVWRAMRITIFWAGHDFKMSVSGDHSGWQSFILTDQHLLVEYSWIFQPKSGRPEK